MKRKDWKSEKKGLEIYGYVVMSNHVHLVAQAKSGNLPDVIHDFKKYFAITILKAIQEEPESRRAWMLKHFEFAARSHVRNSAYQFWTHENHAVELFTPAFTHQRLEYVHQNPIRAGWVEKPEDWLYSSARNYAGLPALMAIDLL